MAYSLELLTVLYELSITNVQHLSPELTAKNFVSKFISKTEWEYGAVWKKNESGVENLSFDRIYSTLDLPPGRTMAYDKYEKMFESSNIIIQNQSIFGSLSEIGNYGYFKMGDFGIFEIFMSPNKQINLTLDNLIPYSDVIRQFTASLESGYAYIQLQNEITQREKAERLLKSNEEKYKRIVENIKLGLVEVDNSDIIQFANEPFLELTGYNLEEVIGKKASDLFLDDAQKVEMHRKNKSRIEGKSDYYEISLTNKAGYKNWVIISGAPNYDQNGKVIGSIGIHLDITEEKQLKEENEFKDMQLKRLFEKSLDALVSVNREGQIIEWSPQAEVIFGYSASEVVGKSVGSTIFSSSNQGDPGVDFQFFIPTAENNESNNRVETWAVRKSGEAFPIELTVFPLHFKDQYYYTAIVRDISELKQSKDIMIKALERQKELVNLKSSFVTMTSHELRTPLTTIRHNAEIADFLLVNEDKFDKEKLRKNIARIESNTERLNQLVSNILLIGQLDSQKVPFAPELLSPVAYIKENVLTDYLSKGHKIKFGVLGEPYLIPMDPSLLSHILVNLLENAIKYSAVDEFPEINVIFKSDFLQIDVKDHGIGIPEKDLERLFETFYRASNVGNIQGTGLGLAIVDQFVKLHGGSISVQSQVNQGSVFSVFLPVKG